MRFLHKSNKDKKSKWHRWFAWHPVSIEGQTIWLEIVLRRREVQSYVLGGNLSYFSLYNYKFL
jgi:hypothetical protein